MSNKRSTKKGKHARTFIYPDGGQVFHHHEDDGSVHIVIQLKEGKTTHTIICAPDNAIVLADALQDAVKPCDDQEAALTPVTEVGAYL